MEREYEVCLFCLLLAILSGVEFQYYSHCYDVPGSRYIQVDKYFTARYGLDASCTLWCSDRSVDQSTHTPITSDKTKIILPILLRTRPHHPATPVPFFEGQFERGSAL